MIALHRALIVLGVIGAVLGGLGLLLASESNHIDGAVALGLLVIVIMFSYIGVGLYAWWRRPNNRIGMLMTAAGFSGALVFLQTSNSSLLFTFGLVIGGGLYFAIAGHMLMAFPTGRIESRFERRLVVAAYVFALGIPLAIALATDESGFELEGEDVDHPDNAFSLTSDDDIGAWVERIGGTVGLVLIGIITWVLVRRVRRAAPRERRAMAPVLWLGAIMLFLLCISFAFDIARDSGDAGEGAIDMASLVAFAGLPYAYLVGLGRTRAWRAGAIGDVLAALGEAPGQGRLGDLLRDALGDPSLRIAYWLPQREQYVDAEGQPLELPPADDPARVVTDVELDGRCIGAMVHARSLREDDPELLRTVASGAAIALQNERLEAELRARVDELQRSRRLLVEAGLRERRRLERDLHDGAQQRLVALSLQLGLVAQQLDKDPAAAKELLDGARTESRAALEDLRELARGIHPAVLTDRGLPAALETLAERAPLPVEVAEVPADRLPVAVEAAAYFVVAESLTNVAKYARASHAEVRVGQEDGYALIEVRDDGIGGADPSHGSGLRGLAERLAAIDGRLEVVSDPGAGTVVRARVPV